ncbi:MAG: hypothetical protein QXX99_02850 [Candidatus Bathyarchaeia archaeon]
MKTEETLGIYKIFPERSHYTAHIKINVPLISLQRIILDMLYGLNGRKVEDDLPRLIGPGVETILEFGVADGLVFNYLDADILNALLRKVGERGLRVLDLLCIVRYYRVRGDKRIALRFDFFFLRFLADNNELKIRAFHERGLQRISAEDLIMFLVKRMRLKLAKEENNMRLF